MSGMVEVLKQHSDWLWSTERGEVLCAGCDWSARPGLTGSSADTFRAHQAAALSAAGFGLVREAQARAYDKGYTHGRYDEKHHPQYSLSGTPRPEKSRRNPYRTAAERGGE